MSLERARQSVDLIRSAIAHPSRARTLDSASLSAAVARDLIESQLLARHLDLAALELRAEGRGHYTIASAGHEGNVVLGRLTRTTDPTLVHYRSAAFVIERARQAPQVDVVRDLVLSLLASADDPIAGGRHKVFGRRQLGIIPQTSTIGSHLPRAVGLAFGLGLRARLGLEPRFPTDSIVVASFGDASINHSTWLGAVNAVGWSSECHVHLPLLLVCEDNGLGISVRSPRGWVSRRLQALPHVEYFRCQGWDLLDTWRVATQAVTYCREQRRPALLHLECERLLGHAGSDVDRVYRSAVALQTALERDPVRCAVEIARVTGLIDSAELGALEAQAKARVADALAATRDAPLLASREQILADLARPVPPDLADTTQERAGDGPRLTLAQGIQATLAEALADDPGVLIFGEDVAKKGGVHGVTRQLLDRFGAHRVFNTPLDEQLILGLGLGLSMHDLLPVAEIQYLAFLHNAEDQLRGEAALLPFLSRGAYDNPLVVRIAGFADPRGTGGPFHNEHSLAVLRDIPGLVVAVPARADDAVALLRTSWELARRARRVVVLVEPIGLYHERDLHEAGDQAWHAPAPQGRAAWGQPRVYHPAAPDLTIASYGPGVRRSLRVARRLDEQHGIRARVLDLRWIAPLPIDPVLSHAGQTKNLLVVEECRANGGVAEGIAAAVLDAAAPIAFARVAAADGPIPLGSAARWMLPSDEEVLATARHLVGRSRSAS